MIEQSEFEAGRDDASGQQVRAAWRRPEWRKLDAGSAEAGVLAVNDNALGLS
jgi:hypothetical protein